MGIHLFQMRRNLRKEKFFSSQKNLFKNSLFNWYLKLENKFQKKFIFYFFHLFVKINFVPFQVALYFLNIFMSLVIGISTVMWTISSKTFHTWQQTICCGLCSIAPAKYNSGYGGANGSSSAAVGANRPLLPVANPPPVPSSSSLHHYMPMTVSSLPPGHTTSSQNAAISTTTWKQSKIM